MRSLLGSTALVLSMALAPAALADDPVTEEIEGQAQPEAAPANDADAASGTLEESTEPAAGEMVPDADSAAEGAAETEAPASMEESADTLAPDADGATEGTAEAEAPATLESTEPAAGTSATEPSVDMADDALAIEGNRAMLAEGALSAEQIVGADVVGSDGTSIGTVDDLVLSSDHVVEQVIVADGEILGFGGKQVAIEFAGAQLSAPAAGEDATVQISMTDEALDQAAEVDTSQLEEQGDRLATSYIGRDVQLASSEEQGEILDLLMNERGEIQYAVIEFGGFLDAGDDQVAVQIDDLTPAAEGEAMSISMSQPELESAPKYEEAPADTAQSQ